MNQKAEKNLKPECGEYLIGGIVYVQSLVPFAQLLGLKKGRLIRIWDLFEHRSQESVDFPCMKANSFEPAGPNKLCEPNLDKIKQSQKKNTKIIDFILGHS